MRKLAVSVSFLALLAFQPAMAQTNTTADVTKPTISGVTVSNVKATTAVVSWTTNEPATSYVDFGLTDVYDKTLGEGTYVSTHSVTLLGMGSDTMYHFRIRSKDEAGNEAVSTDTTLTTASGTANVNTASNTNAATNKNSALNTNLNANANKNTNTAKNANANRNLNTNKNANRNTNANANANVNANANTNSGTDIFNQNVNSDTGSVTGTLENTNTDLTNVNATASTATGDGRTGIILIALGVLLLVGIIAFAWWKARRSPVVRP